MNLTQAIEAYLFYIGEAVSISTLKKVLSYEKEVSEEEIEEALRSLEEALLGRGISLTRHQDMIELRTAPNTHSMLERVRTDELSRDVGRAGLETLAIIAYRGEVSKSDIEYIRGVQSSFILRNLLMRGLIERIPNPRDKRTFLYKPTLDLLGYLGISRLEDLPEYESMKEQLRDIENPEESPENNGGETDGEESEEVKPERNTESSEKQF